MVLAFCKSLAIGPSDAFAGAGGFFAPDAEKKDANDFCFIIGIRFIFD